MADAVPRFRCDLLNGKVVVCKALLVGRRQSWRLYRDPEGGEEWRENGDHWHVTPEQALRHFIAGLLPSRERRLAAALCGGPTVEEDFRLMVQACALLWHLWHEREGP
jgi:hypothetical protein